MEQDSRFVENSSAGTDASLENLVNGNFDLKEESSCTVGTREDISSLASELEKNSGGFNFEHPVELKRDPVYNSVTAENSGLIDAPYVAFVAESTAKIVNRTKFLAFEVDDVQGMVNFCVKTKLSKRVEQVAYFMPQDDCYLPNVIEFLVKLCEFFGKLSVKFLVIPPPPMIHPGYEKVIDFLLVNGTIVQPKRGRSFLEIGWIGNRICTKDVANGEWTQMGLRKVQCFLYEIKGIATMERQICPNEGKETHMKTNVQGQKPKINFPEKRQSPVKLTAQPLRPVVERSRRDRSKGSPSLIEKRSRVHRQNLDGTKFMGKPKQDVRLDRKCRTQPRVSQHFYNPMRKDHRNSDNRFSCFGRRGQFSNHILEYVVPSYCGFPYAWMMEFYRYGRKKPFRDRIIEIW
uniref:Uncharacterized protein n=1 Tax=Acrobeloides nanus TaxID=290746 RepID=A0A914DK39_9BILA